MIIGLLNKVVEIWYMWYDIHISWHFIYILSVLYFYISNKVCVTWWHAGVVFTTLRFRRHSNGSKSSIYETYFQHVAMGSDPCRPVLDTLFFLNPENERKKSCDLSQNISFKRPRGPDLRHTCSLNSKCQRKSHTGRQVIHMCINSLATVLYTSECTLGRLAFCPLATGLIGLTPSLQAATVSLQSEKRKKNTHTHTQQ